jgi:predicted aspartyl protease
MSAKNLNIFTVLGILILGLFSPQQLISSTVSKKNTFPFQIINSLIIIEAEIDGKEGHYILDTGTDAILLDGTPKQAVSNIVTPTGDISTQEINLPSLRVGNFIKYSVDAHIVSLQSLKSELGIDLSGIIGGKFFMPQTLIMDFKNSIITISSEITASEIEGMNTENISLENQVPIITVDIEGTSYRFALDSGATAHFASKAIIDLIDNKKISKNPTDIWSVQEGTVNNFSFIVSTFSLGNVKFCGHHYISYNLDHINKELLEPIDGILSLSEIAHEKIILDFHNEKLYF